MSVWYEVKKEDIELDKDEINVYVYSDNIGSIYAVLKVKDIKELLAN